MVKRVYTRVIRRAPRKRWASHIESFVLAGANYQAATISGASIAVNKTLAVGSTDTAIPTPTLIKTARYTMSYNFVLDLHASANKAPYNYVVNVYLLYVPQGWPIDPGATAVNFVNKYEQLSNLITSHPEWIIAKKQLGDWSQIPGSSEGIYDSRTGVMSSKLKRNLNSGDQVMLAALVSKAFDAAQSNFPFEIKFQGQVTYVTTTA